MNSDPKGSKDYRVVYAVHEILKPIRGASDGKEPRQLSDLEENPPTMFIGLVSLKPWDHDDFQLPENLTSPASAESTSLTLELAYQYLPAGWGKGYATESVSAVFESCRHARSFWAPFSKVYVRAIVNDENPTSLRVMDKTGMTRRGIYEWSGKPVFLAGKWTERSRLHIFDMQLVE